MRSQALILLLASLFFVKFARSQSDELMVQGQTGKLYLLHTVAAKENWYSVGRMYNISPKLIAPLNNTTMSKPLSIGQQLQIPLSAANFSQNGQKAASETLVPVYHIVQEKEWMYRVSVNYNKVPIPSLEKWNNIGKDQVKAGMHLIVGYLKVNTAQSPLAAAAGRPAGVALAVGATPDAHKSGEVSRSGGGMDKPVPARSEATERAKQDRVLAEKEAADRVAQDRLAADKGVKEKTAADKAVTDKSVADKTAAERASADKAAAERVAADKAVADRAAADKVVAEKAAADRVVTEKAAADKNAADRAAADKAAADRAAAEKAASGRVAEKQAAAMSPTINFNGGYFKTDYMESGKSAGGQAGIFKSTSGWQDGKYYALMNNVAVGTIIKITVTSSGRTIYAKILGQLPDMKESAGLSVRISNAAAGELGQGDGRFGVDIRY